MLCHSATVYFPVLYFVFTLTTWTTEFEITSSSSFSKFQVSMNAIFLYIKLVIKESNPKQKKNETTKNQKNNRKKNMMPERVSVSPF